MKSKKGKHKTVDKELKPSIAWLESINYVEKVILGLCESARHKYKPGTLRYQMDLVGGLSLKAYGGRGVMNVHVKIDKAKYKEDLLAKLKKRWDV